MEKNVGMFPAFFHWFNALFVVLLCNKFIRQGDVMNEAKKSESSDWSGFWVLGLFLMCMLLSSWAATQRIASLFGYQEGLGNYLFTFQGWHVYQPFSWFMWTLHWAKEKGLIDEYLTQGMYVMIGGSVFYVLICAFVNFLRTKSGKLPDHLHGSAHWATDDEIRKTGLLCQDGVCVGSVDVRETGFWGRIKKRVHRRILRDNEKTHVLMAAPTRSGKGVGVVLPTLLSWRHSTLVHDVKGENFALTAGFRHKAGQLILKVNPTCKDGTAVRWNSLEEVRIFTLDDVRDAQNIAAMIADPEAKGMEDHWVSTSYKLLTGIILHVCYTAQGEDRSLTTVAKFIADPSFEDVKQMFSFIQGYEHDPSGKMGWRDESGRATRTHPEVILVASEMSKKEEKELGSVISSAVTKLGLYSEPVVAKNIGESDFAVKDLMNLTQPVSCYYVVPPNDKERLRPLTRLFVSFVIRRLTEEMRFEGGTSIEGYKHRLLLMIDELPSLRKLDVLQDGLAYIAGYGMKALLVIQDRVQLKEAYGDKESVSAGCHVQIVYAPNTLDEAKPLSEMLGKKTVEYESKNHSGSRMAHGLGQVSISTQLQARDLITPDELLALPPSDMIVKAAGFSPIRGKKLKFYEMPVFQKRAEIPPPMRCSIEWMVGRVRHFYWAMVLVEKDAKSEMTMWLNMKDREIAPGMLAVVRQERVVDGRLMSNEFFYDFVDKDGKNKNRGPYGIANVFKMQLKGEKAPDLSDEFSVGLRLLSTEGLRNVAYVGEFEVLSDKKKKVKKLAATILGADTKILDIEPGSRNFGKIVLVEGGYAVQDLGFGNTVIHCCARLDTVPKLGDDVLIGYDDAGKLGQVKG